MSWLNHVSSVTVSAGAAVTNPAGGATIANIAAGSLPQGMWAVQLIAGLAGTVTVADSANMQLKAQGSVLSAITLAYPGAAGVSISVLAAVLLDGATALTIIAIGAASGAAAQYVAGIYASRIQ